MDLQLQAQRIGPRASPWRLGEGSAATPELEASFHLDHSFGDPPRIALSEIPRSTLLASTTEPISSRGLRGVPDEIPLALCRGPGDLIHAN